MEDLLKLCNMWLDDLGIEPDSQASAYSKGRCVVVPGYDDGYAIHKPSYCWESRRNDMFYAIDCYGTRKRYADACTAADFAVMV